MYYTSYNNDVSKHPKLSVRTHTHTDTQIHTHTHTHTLLTEVWLNRT